MATSESDDFESADEEMDAETEHKQPVKPNRARRYTSIGSDSDDDVDYIPVQYHTPLKVTKKEKSSASVRDKRRSGSKSSKKSDGGNLEAEKLPENSEATEKDLDSVKNTKKEENKDSKGAVEMDSETDPKKASEMTKDKSPEEATKPAGDVKNVPNRRERPQRQRKPKEASLGAKKLGATKIDKLPDFEPSTPDEISKKAIADGKEPPLIQECWEEGEKINMQEELKNAEKKKNSLSKSKEEPTDVPVELLSNLKFKDIFKPHGWESIGEDVHLPEDFSDDKYHPVLDKLASRGTEKNSTNDSSWSSWGNWGVSSLINTASVGVSTLTSHVSQGLSLLEESMGVPDPLELAKTDSPMAETPKTEPKAEPKAEEISTPKESQTPKESPSTYLPSGFGFGNLISSMSSITKLVEETGSKVISGGLDTFEVIGKKTMEILQEGDPGLKKKRAFFTNEINKPILSQILREAKEKADEEEKTVEEKELARKVHFESLFDDYQGLVHLEALEMLSKQCNMKIQNQLVNLDGSDLTSMQETLDEVKELCDLGDEDDDDEELKGKDLKKKLEEACKDLGVSIKYDKLVDIWNEMNSQMPQSESKDASHRELFQKAISALAQFTAYSVERFHKTAELLLIKERRSTVNEADSLVQLTKTLSFQIGSIANLYCSRLNEFKEENDKSEVQSSVKTIHLEATNASSYVQEAFRLLIPILQVGAI